MSKLEEAFDWVAKNVPYGTERRWPYERHAQCLAIEAQSILENHATEADKRDADRLIALAQVYATLNISDEITRFINVTGVKIQ